MSDISIYFNSSYLTVLLSNFDLREIGWSENPFCCGNERQIILPNLNNIWKGCTVHACYHNRSLIIYIHTQNREKPNTCHLRFASVELVSIRFSFSFSLHLFCKYLLLFNGNSFIFLRLPLNWLGHTNGHFYNNKKSCIPVGPLDIFANEKSMRFATTFPFSKKESNEKSFAH